MALKRNQRPKDDDYTKEPKPKQPINQRPKDDDVTKEPKPKQPTQPKPKPTTPTADILRPTQPTTPTPISDRLRPVYRPEEEDRPSRSRQRPRQPPQQQQPSTSDRLRPVSRTPQPGGLSDTLRVPQPTIGPQPLRTAGFGRPWRSEEEPDRQRPMGPRPEPTGFGRPWRRTGPDPFARRMYDTQPAELDLTRADVDFGPTALSPGGPQADTLSTPAGVTPLAEAQGYRSFLPLGAGQWRPPTDAERASIVTGAGGGGRPGTPANINLQPSAGLAGAILRAAPTILGSIPQWAPAAVQQADQELGVTDSGAYERYLRTLEQNKETLLDPENVGPLDTARYIWDLEKNIWRDIGGLAGKAVRGEATWSDVGETARNVIGSDLALVMSPMQLSRPTAQANVAAQNTLATVSQLPLDYAATRQINDVPAGGYLRAGVDEVVSQLKNFYLAQVTDPKTWTAKKSQFQRTLDAYRQGTTTMGPLTEAQTLRSRTLAGFVDRQTAAKNRDRAYLNWSSPEAVQRTYEALATAPERAEKLKAQADEYLLQASTTTSEAVRAQLMAQAADAYSEGYYLEHQHPIDVVNQNSNVLTDLAFTMFLPDPTDLLGFGLAALGLSPKGRRLANAQRDILVPGEKVAQQLEGLAVGPQTRLATAAAADAARYNKTLNLWTVGEARAAQDAATVIKSATSLLVDADTTADARLLLEYMARDPAALVRGVPASQFQSAGLLARADDQGLIRFGASGMNTPEYKRALNSFRSIADEYLANSQVLNTPGELNKIDMMMELAGAVKQGGYRYYGVATDVGLAPFGTSTVRVKTAKGGQGVLQYLDKDGKVLSVSEPLNLRQASRMADQFNRGKDIGWGGRLAGKDPLHQTSVLGAVSTVMRKAVSPFYIYLSPGTWATNFISANALAGGDGMWAGGNVRKMRLWDEALFRGVRPTLRAIEGEATEANLGATGAGGIFGPLKRWYSKIEEFNADRVVHRAQHDALLKVGRPALEAELAPILQAHGITDPARQRQISNRLFEVGYTGGDMLSEFNAIIGGNTRQFSLADIDPNWTDVVARDGPDSLKEFQDIIRTAQTPEEFATRINQWADATRKPWEALALEGSDVPQRRVFSNAAAQQDLADINQLVGNIGVKRAGMTQAEALALTKANADAFQSIQQNTDLLTQMVTASGNPNNRYILYNVWAEDYTETTRVRMRQAELAEQAFQQAAQNPSAAAAIWRQYVDEVSTLWQQRNTKVLANLENGAAALREGKDYTPDFSVWGLLERTAAQDEAALRKTLEQEPTSGRYDARLGLVIQAGQALVDQAVARTFAAARRYNSPSAMDWIISAERNTQAEGARVAGYVDSLRGAVPPDEFYAKRNAAWRELREYEQAMWNDATHHIVEEGTKLEKATPSTADVVRSTPALDDDLTEVPLAALPDNNELRSLAQQLGIATASPTGQPINQHLVNAINKDFKQRGLQPIRSLDTMTDEQRRAAREVLQERLRKQGKQITSTSDIQRELNLGNRANLGENWQQVSRQTTENVTSAGGAAPDTLANGANYALDTIEDIRRYMIRHADEVLTPKRTISEAQALAILNQFAQKVVPAWDNVRAFAAEYGDRMRSFTMLDTNNQTRLDQALGLYMPYGFFFTRSAKNAAERTLFQPHIWRRVMQYKNAATKAREQQEDPARYDGGMPFNVGDNVYYFMFAPSKYWQAIPLMIQNDYADPESANNAFSWAVENATAVNASPYPWWDVANKTLQGKQDEIYPAAYTPVGKILAWAAPQGYGYNLPAWARPTFYEYNVGRELTTMVSEGKITPEEALMGQDILRQMQFGEQPLPEQKQFDPRIVGILDEAASRASNGQLIGAVSGFLTGMSVKPFDTDEARALEAKAKYAARGYDPLTNPMGSNLAENYTFQEYPELSPRFAQSSLMNQEYLRPGVSAARSLKRAEEQKVYDRQQAEIEAYLAANPAATFDDIRAIRDKYEAELEAIRAKYPSAEYSADRPMLPPKGMNPQERAVWELERILKATPPGMTYPTRPPNFAALSPEEKAAQYTKEGQWYDAKYDRIEENLNRILSGDESGGTNPWMSELRKLVQGQYASELSRRFSLKHAGPLEREWNEYAVLNRELTQAQIAESDARLKATLSPADYALYQQYKALPEGSEERRKFSADHSIIKVANAIAYNPEQYQLVEQKWGDKAWEIYRGWPEHPGDGASEAQLAAYKQQVKDYVKKHPNAAEIRLWINGRSLPSGLPQEYYRFDWGRDYQEIVSLYGPGIFEEAANRPVYIKGNKASGKAYGEYMDAHPNVYGYDAWLYEFRDMTPEDVMKRRQPPPDSFGAQYPTTYAGPRPVGSGREPIGGGEATWPTNIWGEGAVGPQPVLPGQQPRAGEQDASGLAGWEAMKWQENLLRQAKAIPIQQPITSDLARATVVTGAGLGPNLPTTAQPGFETKSGMTAQDYINANESYQKALAYDREFAARRSRVAALGEEYGAMWDEYYALPEGEARDQYRLDHPEMKLLNIAAYNPEEYKAASELFTVEEMLAWSQAPRWDGTPEADALREQYWKENPRSWLVGAWMNGRPGATEFDENADPATYKRNFGEDWRLAQERYGENIWDIVFQYRGADRARRRALRNQFPQYQQWADWWYANLPDTGRSTGVTRQSFGWNSYGGGGGGGGYGGGGYGGGSGQQYPRNVDLPYVEPRWMSGELRVEAPPLRNWRPWNVDLSWQSAGANLRPAAPRPWRPPSSW